MFESFNPSPSGGLLDALTGVDPAGLDVLGKVEYLAACARVESRVVALKMLAVESIAAEHAVEQAVLQQTDVANVADAGREIVMSALHVSGLAAGNLIEQADRLVNDCQQTLHYLSEGLVSPGVARVVGEETRLLGREQIAQVEQRVLVRAGHQSPGDVRRCVKRVIALTAPELFAQHCGQAAKTRCVSVAAAEHGMAWFNALLPAPLAMDLFAVVDADARAAKKLDREHLSASDGEVGELDSIDIYRADAFVALMQNSGKRSNDLGQADNQPTTPRRANIVIDLPTLLGLDDQPGELEGYGPIPANLARQLAKDATWQRWITEPTTGHLLELGRTRYIPNTALREYICARDQVCRFPHCNQPAKRNDIDHAIPWDTGGQSNPDNLGSLCRRHHRLKTFNRWQITESHADGTCVWRSPAGHTITTEPPLPLVPPHVE